MAHRSFTCFNIFSSLIDQCSWRAIRRSSSSRVHFFDQMGELLMQERALDLARGRNRFALDFGIELAIENAERFHLLNPAEPAIRPLDLAGKLRR